MKNNKAFTIVELVVVIMIITMISAMITSIFVKYEINPIYVLIKLLCYFITPSLVFLTMLKLNQKYRWILKMEKAPINSRGVLYSGESGRMIDRKTVYINLWMFFLLWPIYIPIILSKVIYKKLYEKYLQNVFTRVKNMFRFPTFYD